MAVLSNTGIRAGASAAVGDSGYKVEKSLRFDAEDTPYLSNTPSSNTGNQKQFTISFWTKVESDRSNTRAWCNGGPTSSTSGVLQFYIEYGKVTINSNTFYMQSNRRLRDPAAWYHICLAVDTTLSTADDRMKVWVNNERITDWASNTPPAHNSNVLWNTSTIHQIGAMVNSGGSIGTHLSGLLAEFHNIDGQTLDPSSFGEENSNGKWIPKEYTGTHGPLVDQSQTWSDSITGGSGAYGALANAFDSDLSTYASPAYASAMTYTNASPSDTVIQTFEVYCEIYSMTGITVELNETDITSQLTTTDTWHTITGFTDEQFEKFHWNANSSGHEVRVRAIRINGKILVDDDVTVVNNSFYFNFSGPDLGEDSSGNDNDWTVNNLTAGGPAWSDVLMPTWTTIGSDWTTTNSDRSGTYSGSSYSWLISENLDTDKVYKFRFYKKDTSSYGGWCLCDSTNPNKTVPNEISQEEGNSTAVASLGQRNQYSTVGTWGSYATANSTSEATGQLNIFSTLNTQEATFDVVINRVVNKCWMRKVGESSWIGSGDPDNTSSASTFELPDDTNMYWCFVGHSSQGTANITNGSPEVLEADSTADSPTDYDDEGNGVGNYATWNPLYHMRAGSGHYTLAQGNRRAYDANNTYGFLDTTMYAKTGKWYAEIWLTGGTLDGAYDNIGIVADQQRPSDIAGSLIGYWYSGDGDKVDENTGWAGTAYGASWALGDIIGVAMDLDNGTLTFYKNGVSQGVAFNNLNPYYSYSFAISDYSNAVSFSYAHINTGFVPFEYDAPTGYKAMNTYNLPDPVIADPSKYFDASVYTGAGSSVDVSTNFSPDLVWVKSRLTTSSHNIIDKIRGDDSYLMSNSTDGEDDSYADVLELKSDGYTVGSNNSAFSGTNGNIGWAWDAGEANTSVSAGDLNSSAYDQSVKWSGNNNATTGTVRTQSGSYYDSTYDALELFSGDLDVQIFAESTNQWIEWTPANGAGGSDGTAENYTFTDKVEVYCTSAQDQVFTFKDSDDNTIDTTITSAGWTIIKTGGGTLKSIKSLGTGGDYAYWSGIRIDGKWLIDSDVTLPNQEAINVPTLPSTYRANPTAGFSIVEWDGHGSTNETVAHGLGAKPDFMICKKTSTGGNSWVVWHRHIANYQYLILNATSSEAGDSTLFNSHNNTDSHVFSVGTNSSFSDTSQKAIAYCWSEVEGYSKFGKYEGDASTGADNAWVNCGFKPALIIIKMVDSSNHWMMYDLARNPINDGTLNYLKGESPDDEDNNFDVEFLSNGFKIRDGNSNVGGSSNRYIFAAWADKPFKYSNAH